MATADKTTETVAPVETPAVKPGRKSSREDGGKQVGAWFNPDAYHKIREARFVGRFDKDSDLVKAAVDKFVEDILTAQA